AANDLPVVGYDADVFTTSLEAGYAFKPDWHEPVVIEPQGQLIYQHYDQDNVVDATDTFVSANDGSFWTSRLGVRAHGTWNNGWTRYQPYLELSWWHDFDDDAVALNGLSFAGGVPQDRYEGGLGLNVEVARNWTVWGNAEYQLGDDHYEAVEG